MRNRIPSDVAYSVSRRDSPPLQKHLPGLSDRARVKELKGLAYLVIGTGTHDMCRNNRTFRLQLQRAPERLERRGSCDSERGLVREGAQESFVSHGFRESPRD